jgi:hypothetical protein
MAGAAYVIFGSTSLPPVIDLAQTPADATLEGAAGNGFFGDAVASTDANGDGFGDVIVGAPFAPRPPDRERPGQLAGAVYVWFGGESLEHARDVSLGEVDLVIYGNEEFEGGDEPATTLPAATSTVTASATS